MSVETLKGHLTSAKSISFYTFTFALLCLTFFVAKRMLKSLAIFEQEAENYLRGNIDVQNDEEEKDDWIGAKPKLPSGQTLINEASSQDDATSSLDNDFKNANITYLNE